MAQDYRIVVLQNLSYGKKVTQRLGHLLLIDVQEAIVEPIICKRPAHCTFGLCDFVLVMREYEVASAAVNVERLRKILCAHRRTFDMPPRPPSSPGALPARFTGLARLPQSKV